MRVASMRSGSWEDPRGPAAVFASPLAAAPTNRLLFQTPPLNPRRGGGGGQGDADQPCMGSSTGLGVGVHAGAPCSGANLVQAAPTVSPVPTTVIVNEVAAARIGLLAEMRAEHTRR